MGSFSVACSISKLSINNGDKCVFIPILKNSFQDKYNRTVLVGPCDRFLPLTVPIIGYYNDYGGIEDVERNENTELIEKYFDIDIEEFVQVIWYNDYEKVKNKEKRTILEKVYPMYVLYDVYLYSCNNFRTLSYEKEEKVLLNFNSGIKRCNNEISFFNFSKSCDNEKQFYDSFVTSMKHEIENLFPFNSARGFQYNNSDFMDIYLKTVFDGKKFYNPSDFMMNEFINFYYFIISMIYTNSSFDIVRQGTQYGETEIELQNIKLYCSILEERLRKEQEEDY